VKVLVPGSKVAPAGTSAEYTSGSVSTSVAETVKLSSMPSLTYCRTGTVSTGASFTGVSVIETVASLLSSRPSLAFQVKASRRGSSAPACRSG
jgi:hypothetical protein